MPTKFYKVIPAKRTDAYSMLSAKEIDCLKLAALGLGTKTIGQQMGISPDTVKNHLYSAHIKLDVPNTTRAVVECIKSGLIKIGEL